MREYKVEEATRTSYELEASAVGHDLTRGMSQFRRVARPKPGLDVETDGDGIPVDSSDLWLGLAELPPGDEGARVEEPKFAPAK
jgi:single-strand DNA-binding protein